MTGRLGRLELTDAISRLGAGPSVPMLVLAAVGAGMLAVVATTRWGGLQDEYAYWLAGRHLLAGQPLYDPTAFPGTPYAYWYPPPLAQVLAPLTAFVPDAAFVAAWTAVLLACLWYLSGRRPLVALAMIAFVPVAVELWYRNVHLILAVLVVIALRRSPFAWIPAILIKVTPGLGLVYLLGARRYRDLLVVSVAVLVLVGLSIAVSPGPWRSFLEMVFSTATISAASIIPIPFPVRLAAGVVLAFAGGRLGGRRGEAMLITGLVVANPTLWATTLSLFAALIPLYRTSGNPDGETSGG